jgi:hypothetical protein
VKILLLPLLAATLAAENNPRFWASYFGDHRVTKHWGIHFDGQLRQDFTQPWGQVILRPGLNYYVKPNLFLSHGYAFIRTESNNTTTPEHRLWQQVQYTPKVLNLNMSHRLRLEQRWIEIPTGHRYQNRIRYFYRTELPATGKYFVGLQNEIFLGFGQNKGASVYDQNRAYISLGRRFGPIGRIETGYMYQNALLRNGITREHNHILVISYLSAFTKVK